jgi:membrane protein
MFSSWKLGGLGWGELAKRVWGQINEDDIFGNAAKLSYYFLLALFPLLLFVTTMLGYFADAGSQLRTELLHVLSTVIPADASSLIFKTVNEVQEHAGGGKLSFGILATLWAASNGMGALTDALNVAYEVRETRPWWKSRLIAVALTIVLSVLILSALVLVLFGGHIAVWIAAHWSFGAVFVTAWKVLQWVVVLAFVLLAFALMYYFAPDVHTRRWQWIAPGTIIAVVLWLVVSFAFRLYLHFFNSYSATYGALGAVIILMLWFYLTGAAILVGGEINSEIIFAEAGLAPSQEMRGEHAAMKEPDAKKSGDGKEATGGRSGELTTL